ncbi:sulfur oxidation c-type cytochrome SoxX [Magnetofaba australis]|uniref:Putative monoheme cytochrome SoxX n=1 Tax=Magnetofaba australis IT-1 TaxID=1434232 RepID=A0A1Y2K693_9PROT|nr:sulfur oxidation c-type cytochrome SoxX [Magnetofaba australis]OSM05194.1 putative monoheme cytochrome SoxX [Magnetofaba australis IT-1]
MKSGLSRSLAVLAAMLLTAGCAANQPEQELSAEEIGIATPLTDKPGDPVNGAKLVTTRSKGNCIACHWMPIGTFHGSAGPNMLDAMQHNERSVGWIRQKIVNPKVDNPDTVMFTFYSNEGKSNIRKDWQGKRVLEAQEVEDIIAYLLTLRNMKPETAQQ